MTTVSRVLVTGWPNLEVRALDARLHLHGGGAQMWRCVGNPDARAVVGVEIPDDRRRAEACRRIVAEWAQENGLGSGEQRSPYATSS